MTLTGQLLRRFGRLVACPKCGSTETTYGYGLAGGGIGTYLMCLSESCGHLWGKTQDPDDIPKGGAK